MFSVWVTGHSGPNSCSHAFGSVSFAALGRAGAQGRSGVSRRRSQGPTPCFPGAQSSRHLSAAETEWGPRSIQHSCTFSSRFSCFQVFTLVSPFVLFFSFTCNTAHSIAFNTYLTKVLNYLCVRGCFFLSNTR